MSLPRRILKPLKRSSRWRSRAHCDFVRSHACCNCKSEAAIEVAHVRMNSGAGMGQKPDDWRTVSLCRICHMIQHKHGEPLFWSAYKVASGQDVEDLIEDFIKASPRRREIEEERRSREH